MPKGGEGIFPSRLPHEPAKMSRVGRKLKAWSEIIGTIFLKDYATLITKSMLGASRL
jgi:hypothetical protein